MKEKYIERKEIIMKVGWIEIKVNEWNFRINYNTKHSLITINGVGE